MESITKEQLILWLTFLKEHNPKLNDKVESVLELTGVFCKDIELLEKIVPLIKNNNFEEVIKLMFPDSKLIYQE